MSGQQLGVVGEREKESLCVCGNVYAEDLAMDLGVGGSQVWLCVNSHGPE